MEAADFSGKNLVVRVLKASVKAFLIYIVYFIFTLITQPIYEFIGEYNQLVGLFFVAMIIFVFLVEFFSGTIVRYMLDFSKGLFIIFYFIATLNGGIIEMKIENIGLTVNLQFFLLMLILITVIGIARTVLSAVNFLHEKSEKEPLNI